ncbi:MAG: nitroreductase family protein, partial [Methanosarcinales archaeon]|nr:nitroreductase family protein [Methanosarcinales archaeon]
MELLDAIKLRRSVRAYKPDPVPEEVLTELLDIVRWAPSATNTQ